MKCPNCDEDKSDEEAVTVRVDGEDESWCQACAEDYTEMCDKCRGVVPQSVTQEIVDRGDVKHWCKECSENSAECTECHQIVPVSQIYEVIDVGSGAAHDWCSVCREDRVIGCDRCQDLMDRTVRGSVGEEDWCPNCVDRYALACHLCDRFFSRDEENTVDGHSWCERCTDNYASYCDNCEVYHSNDDGCPYGSSDDDDDIIWPYHTCRNRGFKLINSSWVDAQPKPLRFGVELEVEVTSGERSEYAYAVRDSMGQGLLAGMEEDSSLNHGFEIITNPAGLDVHREVWPGVRLKGLKSHDTDTCGLHIHVTRSAISKLTLGKILEFTYADVNGPFMETFARRGFADTDFAKKVSGLKISEAVKQRPERYEAWNTKNEKTVEFRLPKGTTKATTILATIEFTYAIIRFCERESAKGLTVERFKRMITRDAWLLDTRFLRAYLVDRGLSTVKEMRLPKIKPAGSPPPVEDVLAKKNPSEHLSYAELALDDYLTHGEQSTALTSGG